MKKYVIGIDLGGTKIEVCMLDTGKKLISRKEIILMQKRGINMLLITPLD